MHKRIGQYCIEETVLWCIITEMDHVIRNAINMIIKLFCLLSNSNSLPSASNTISAYIYSVSLITPFNIFEGMPFLCLIGIDIGHKAEFEGRTNGKSSV